jgi:hypothetical protein
MKIRNEDIKKITEIKQYLLDPPVSFKLYDYALVYIQDSITVLSAYPGAEKILKYLQTLHQQLEQKEIPQDALRSTLIEAGRKISTLTSK